MIELKSIITKYPECLSNCVKFKSILHDMYPKEKRLYFNILSDILESGVIAQIKVYTELDTAVFDCLCEEINNKYGYDIDIVATCLQIWATAFDVQSPFKYSKHISAGAGVNTSKQTSPMGKKDKNIQGKTPVCNSIKQSVVPKTNLKSNNTVAKSTAVVNKNKSANYLSRGDKSNYINIDKKSSIFAQIMFFLFIMALFVGLYFLLKTSFLRDSCNWLFDNNNKIQVHMWGHWWYLGMDEITINQSCFTLLTGLRIHPLFFIVQVVAGLAECIWWIISAVLWIVSWIVLGAVGSLLFIVLYGGNAIVTVLGLFGIIGFYVSSKKKTYNKVLLSLFIITLILSGIISYLIEFNVILL